MNVHYGQGVDLVVERLHTSADDVRQSLGVLSAPERQRAGRYTLDRDRRRYITRRAHLRRLLGQRLGWRPKAFEFSTGLHGKPALMHPRISPPFHFNISHSDDLTMYAFSSGAEIGVDVEAIRPVEDADRLAPLVMSRPERAMYFGLTPTLRPIAFLYAWTRKEAFVKATGEGLDHPLRGDTAVFTAALGDLVHAHTVDSKGRSWRVRSVLPAEGFVAAIATEVLA